MAQERLKTIVGHLKGGGINNVISMFEDKNILEEVNKKIAAAQSKGGFRFTLDSCRLSDEQRRFYEDNGFIIMRNLVSSRDLETYKKRFQDIADGKLKVPGLVVMKDISKVDADHSEHVVNKLQELYMDEVLFSYCTLPQILDYASSFCGPNLTAVHTMLINKPPDTGALTSRHPLHQDLYYFPFRPADRIVCAWTALEKVTRENGCLVAIPGSHHGELLEHGYPEWEVCSSRRVQCALLLWLYILTTVIICSMVCSISLLICVCMHAHSTVSVASQAISCHYAASECEYIDVEGSVQDPIAEEVLEIFHKRFPNIPVKNYALNTEMCEQRLRDGFHRRVIRRAATDDFAFAIGLRIGTGGSNSINWCQSLALL
ncbi:hypothetical protein HPB49_005300 [Dermacentor silvarum]|uniref:Uncharacterized protein n=1 Tax=Dermacentor silvarum TaxID=543639 RepID=A0ACB8DN42_DERSI|nr:hypothetical protein HPB49_005300 [Dermacentor silvarum]